jgi:hypothetical protein
VDDAGGLKIARKNVYIQVSHCCRKQSDGQHIGQQTPEGVALMEFED